MRTYPLITRYADGTESTLVCADYPEQSAAVDLAKCNPQATQIETRRIKDGVDQGIMLWIRETAAHLGKGWYGKQISE